LAWFITSSTAQSALLGQLVSAFVAGITRMAFCPAPANVMRLFETVDVLPHIKILARLICVSRAFDEPFTVAVKLDLVRLVEQLERFNGGH
jgi:hypothetical protein